MVFRTMLPRTGNRPSLVHAAPKIPKKRGGSESDGDREQEISSRIQKFREQFCIPRRGVIQ